MRKNCEVCGSELGKDRSNVKGSVHKGVCLILSGHYGYYENGKLKIRIVALRRMQDIISKFSPNNG